MTFLRHNDILWLFEVYECTKCGLVQLFVCINYTRKRSNMISSTSLLPEALLFVCHFAVAFGPFCQMIIYNRAIDFVYR